jgi:hypothetical protein
MSLRLNLLGALVVGVGAAATAADFAEFYYDSTQGATTVYTGDLAAGILDLAHIDGRTFRAQRVPGDTGFGTFSVGGASLDAQLAFDSFNSAGMGGPGDLAIFSGTGLFGGFDFLAVDEFGESIAGFLPEVRFMDRTDDPFLPGVVGTAAVTGLQFSGLSFQGISLEDLEDQGTLFTFTMVIPGVTLEDYLASSGLGGVAVPLDTLELHINGIPTAPTGLLLAAAAMAVPRRRR